MTGATTTQALVMHAAGEPADALRPKTPPMPEPDAGIAKAQIQWPERSDEIILEGVGAEQ
jgi:hypothetical protein